MHAIHVILLKNGVCPLRAWNKYTVMVLHQVLLLFKVLSVHHICTLLKAASVLRAYFRQLSTEPFIALISIGKKPSTSAFVPWEHNIKIIICNIKDIRIGSLKNPIFELKLNVPFKYGNRYFSDVSQGGVAILT